MGRPRTDRTVELRALITPDLRVMVGAAALRNGRSLAAEVEVLLREGLTVRDGADGASTSSSPHEEKRA